MNAQPFLVRTRAWLALVLSAALGVAAAAAQTATPPPATYPELPSEIPEKFEARTASFDHVKRDVMIPMRGGVKLHTVILVPKGAQGAAMLLTRTPSTTRPRSQATPRAATSGPSSAGTTTPRR